MSANSSRWMPVAGLHAANPTGSGTPPIIVGTVSYYAQPTANAAATTGFVDVPGTPLTGIGPNLPPGWICLGQVGATSERPHFDNSSYPGYTFVDTTLNAILTWDGLAWRKPDGTVA